MPSSRRQAASSSMIFCTAESFGDLLSFTARYVVGLRVEFSPAASTYFLQSHPLCQGRAHVVYHLGFLHIQPRLLSLFRNSDVFILLSSFFCVCVHEKMGELEFSTKYSMALTLKLLARLLCLFYS